MRMCCRRCLKDRCLPLRPHPAPGNRSRPAECQSLGTRHRHRPLRLHPHHQPQCRHREHEHQRQRLHLRRTNQAELEQLLRSNRKRTHLQQPADQERRTESQDTEAEQRTGLAGQSEKPVQDHRRAMAGCQQRTATLRCRHREAAKHTDQLRPHPRAIQPRHEEYRGTLTEKNNLLNAQQETLQAKYMAILNTQLLKFYQGEQITL